MSRWLEKQEQLIAEEAKELGVAVEAPQNAQFRARKYKHGDFHTWKRGDSLFDIAQDMNVTLEQLMSYNEIESYEELEDGIPIHYPAPMPSSKRKISVEMLQKPLHMHINKPGGAKKWAFGSMRTWDDASPTGFFPENTNIMIVAIAKVPIDDKDEPFAEAAYYLEYSSLGDYNTTGHLRYTLGFAWSDLEEGEIEGLVAKTTPPPDPTNEAVIETPVETETPKQVTEPRVPDTLEGFDSEFVQKRLEDFKRDGSMSKFTESYQKLVPPILCIAMLPDDAPGVLAEPSTGQKYIWIRDFAMKRPNRRLFINQEVEVAATFEYDGEIYGRPVESVKNNNFFGIPMSMLQSQDDLFMYNNPIDATTRAEIGGSLTWSERYVWVPINRWLSKYAPGYIKKIKTQKIQKG